MFSRLILPSYPKQLMLMFLLSTTALLAWSQQVDTAQVETANSQPEQASPQAETVPPVGASPAADPNLPVRTAPAENPLLQVKPFRKSIEREGIRVDVAIDHVAPVNKVPGIFSEGDYVKVGFSIHDTATGAPVRNAYPAAWLDLISPGEERNEGNCTAKLKTFIGGSLITAPELDLNQYYVIAMNQDATLTVVDPVFGFGGSKLLAMIELDSPGGDWARSADQSRLFVSMPDSDRIAVIETASWKLVSRLESGPQPGRMILQPDQHFLWSAYQGRGPDANGGVVIFRASDLSEVARIEVGSGAHDIVFDSDSRYAFVSNRKSNSVSVIDVRALKKVADVPTASEPVSLDYSPLAQSVYVATLNGAVVMIDATNPKTVANLQLEPGLGHLRFAPGGRFAFVASTLESKVHVIDATLQRVIQSAKVMDHPDQIAFSTNLGYIRHAGSETVLMVPLAEVGQEGKQLGVIDFPGGQQPPAGGLTFTPASGMVQAPGADAMLVCNGPDEAIYFYREGMAAPMGQFSNYGHAPRAVIVIDRSLREYDEPGRYESFVRLDKPGEYDLVFFLDSPRLAHCFGLGVNVDATLQAERNQQLVSAAIAVDKVVPVGKPVTVTIALHDYAGKTFDKLNDLTLLVNLQPGIWHHRYAATYIGEGNYQVSITPPKAGVYYLYAASKEAGLAVGNDHYTVFRAGPAKDPQPKKEREPIGNN